MRILLIPDSTFRVPSILMIQGTIFCIKLISPRQPSTPSESRFFNEDPMRQNCVTLVIVNTIIEWLIKQQNFYTAKYSLLAIVYGWSLTVLDLILYLDIAISDTILCQNIGLYQLSLLLVNFAETGSITAMWCIWRSFCTTSPFSWCLPWCTDFHSLWSCRDRLIAPFDLVLFWNVK